MAASVRRPAQCGRQQFRLPCLGFLLDLRLSFHIIMLLLFMELLMPRVRTTVSRRPSS